MTQYLPVLSALIFLALPGAAMADGPGHGGGGGGCHGGCGGGGYGHGGRSVSVDVDVSASAQAYSSAYARSDSYSESGSSSGGYFMGGGGVYGGGYALPYAVGGGGVGYNAGCGCYGVVPVGPVYAPYGPQGPFVTYQVIESRTYRREYAREEVDYRASVSGGYAYERGGYDRRERYEDHDRYEGRYEDRYGRDDYDRRYDEDYGSDVPYVPHYDTPPPPPPPSYSNECWQDRTGECG